MPDKKWEKLLEADRQIRMLSPNTGMTNGTEPQIRITLIRGFELFNTRPYHNYEDWSDGYKAEAFWEGYIVAIAEAEDLDDCFKKLEIAIGFWKEAGGGISGKVYKWYANLKGEPFAFIRPKEGYYAQDWKSKK